MRTGEIKGVSKMLEKSGQLSNCDIIAEQSINESLRIVPFEAALLKAASYDITPSIIAMSAKTGMLETVYREQGFPFRHYIVVSAKDSILAVSNEYVYMPSHIAGHIVSRVSKVIEGFGHISTSVDPGWSGALLIALSNPSNKPLKVYVGKSLYEESCKNPLATLCLEYLNTPANTKNVSNPENYLGMRLDLLEKTCYRNRRGLRAWLQRRIHPRRREFTDYFFEYCEVFAHKQNPIEWEEFIAAFGGTAVQIPMGYQEENAKGLSRKKKNPYDFVICETHFVRFLYWCKEKMRVFYGIAISCLILLVLTGILQDTTAEAIARIIQIFS